MVFLPSIVGVLVLVAAATSHAVEVRSPQGTLRGFPVVVDLVTKEVLAHGTRTQWLEGGLLHVTTSFQFKDGRQVLERFAVRQDGELVQKHWRWEERASGTPVRWFEVDFDTGQARGMKVQKGKRKEWDEKLKIVPGQTFAGGAFGLVLENLAPRLKQGQKVELSAVGPTPKPRVVKVEISSRGIETLQLADREVKADHFVMHPVIPAIARLFVKAPDNHLWFYHSPPSTFLRARGPLVEPGDPIIEIDVEPPARPAEARPAPKD